MSLLAKLKDVEYFYEPIRNIYSGKDEMIHKKNSKYSILKPEHGFPNAKFVPVYETDSHTEFLDECNSRSLDLDKIDSAVSRVLLDEGAWAMMKLQKIQKYFSDATIEAQLEGWRMMTKKIVAIIDNDKK